MTRRPARATRLGRALLLAGPLLLLLAGAGARAFAQTPGAGGGDLDDPKLARRLKTRVAIPLAGVPAAPRGPAPAPAPMDPLAVTPSLPPPVASLPPGPPPASSSRSASPPAPDATIGTTAEPPPLGTSGSDSAPPTATLQIGYRRFSFVRIGAVDPGSTSGKPIDEPFDNLSLDFYPISRTIRFGISTQYGWQSGTFDSGSGDYFVAQSVSLGLQYAMPSWTPFAQGMAGAGYMRRFQLDRTVPTAYWQFGIDAGVEVPLGRHAFVTAALGYLHPVNGFLKEQSFASIYVDTWSFKLAFGI